MEPTKEEWKSFGCCTWNRLGGFLWAHFQPLMGWCVTHRLNWMWRVLKCQHPVVNATRYDHDGISQVWCKEHTPSADKKNCKGDQIEVVSLE